MLIIPKFGECDRQTELLGRVNAAIPIRDILF